MTSYLTVFRAFITDQRGKVTIAQWPNISAWLLIASLGLRAIAPSAWHISLDVAIVVLLTYWAWQELKDGASPFRRLLGLVGLLLAARHLLMLMGNH